eukprot:3995514-Pyramimonas_sp.AAC.1
MLGWPRVEEPLTHADWVCGFRSVHVCVGLWGLSEASTDLCGGLFLLRGPLETVGAWSVTTQRVDQPDANGGKAIPR